MRRSAAAALLLATVPAWSLGWSPPARADARSTESRTTAAEQVRRGDAARKARRWADAQAAYTAAWEQNKDPVIAGELGACELALGKYRDAAEHLYLSLEHPEALAPEQHRRFADAKSKAQERIATLAISASPPDAEVFVDGKSLGAPQLSYIVFVEPGQHFARARFKGMGDAMTTVNAQPGDRPIVVLELQRAKPGASTVPRPEVTHGDPIRTWRTVGFAAAGVAAVTGGGLAIAAAAVTGQISDRSASLGDDSACLAAGPARACEDLADRKATRDALAIGASLGFAASALIGGVALSSYLWADSDGGVTVSPKTTGRDFGVLLRGSW